MGQRGRDERNIFLRAEISETKARGCTFALLLDLDVLARPEVPASEQVQPPEPDHLALVLAHGLDGRPPRLPVALDLDVLLGRVQLGQEREGREHGQDARVLGHGRVRGERVDGQRAGREEGERLGDGGVVGVLGNALLVESEDLKDNGGPHRQTRV